MLLLLTLCINPHLHAQSTAVQSVDRIVAVVDEDVVVRSELEGEMRKILIQFQQNRAQLPPQPVIEKQVLERLILKKLQLAAAQRAGITVSEDVLAQAINNIARNNSLNLSDFRRTLEQEGIDFRSFRESIRDQITLQRLKEQEISQRIRVTEQEVNAFLSRQESGKSGRTDYHLFHILIATPEGASPEQIGSARDKAERVLGELRDGGDFQNIALTESDGRQALEGGDLGWRPVDQLPTIFSDVVTDMDRGGISEPIRTPSGFHIIKLQDYKGGDRQIITQTHTRHILIVTSEITSDDEARTRLAQLRTRITGGDDFAALARSHSDDKSSALKGGDLGWVTPGDLVPKFEEEMASLGAGELSEPFRTEFGWHLVQVLARRDHDSTDEVRKAEARDSIRKRKLAEEVELYLRRLRDEAYVDIRLNDL